METKKIFTLECYRMNTDKNKKIRVHTGTFEENRDFLSACMYWTREFYANCKTDAISQAKAVCRALTHEHGVKHSFTN